MKNNIIHTSLIIILIISILLILWIDFELFPKVEVSFSENRIERINNAVSNISISSLSSIFFYFLIVFLPAYFNKKKSTLSIKYLLEQEFHYLSLLESYFEVVYKLKLHNQVNVIRLDKKMIRLSYETNKKLKTNSKLVIYELNDNTIFSEDEFLLDCFYQIDFINNKLFSLPVLNHCDYRLINNLTNIKNLNFTYDLKCFNQNDKYHSLDFSPRLRELFIEKNNFKVFLTKNKFFVENIKVQIIIEN